MSNYTNDATIPNDEQMKNADGANLKIEALI